MRGSNLNSKNFAQTPKDTASSGDERSISHSESVSTNPTELLNPDPLQTAETTSILSPVQRTPLLSIKRSLKEGDSTATASDPYPTFKDSKQPLHNEEHDDSNNDEDCDNNNSRKRRKMTTQTAQQHSQNPQPALQISNNKYLLQVQEFIRVNQFRRVYYQQAQQQLQQNHTPFYNSTATKHEPNPSSIQIKKE